MEFVEIKKNDSKYPRLLHEIYNPPKMLYAKGNLNLLSKTCISVIGTRKFSDYGKRMCKKIISELKDLNVCIVSGLAMGIDTIAHESALENNMDTIAVLGSGINNIYPKSNLELANKIAFTGLLLSEYPDMSEPQSFHFPQRNRIVSGLSVATIVIEAPERSGTLITARLALEQGREIFAVCGDADRENSIGTLRLLQYSAAYPIRSGLDVIEVLKRQPTLFEKYDRNKEKKSSVVSQESAKNMSLNLSQNEIKVFDSISLHRGTDVSVIQKKSDLKISEILATLSILELKGFISNNIGKYRRVF